MGKEAGNPRDVDKGVRVAELEKNVDQFNSDVRSGRSYRYTSGKCLSANLANQRISDEVSRLVALQGKRVIDVGCGDGTYTFGLADSGAARVLGVDAADGAVESATGRVGQRTNLAFRVLSVYELQTLEEPFDIAVVRGVLHHLDRPAEAIRAIAKVADLVVIVEPNGYNPVLKVIEKCSRYHREHGEKSYAPLSLDKWFRRAGGDLARFSYIGLVPMFCPSFLAKVLKAVEPLVEKIPLVRHLCCGQYTAVYATRKGK